MLAPLWLCLDSVIERWGAIMVLVLAFWRFTESGRYRIRKFFWKRFPNSSIQIFLIVEKKALVSTSMFWTSGITVVFEISEIDFVKKYETH